MYTEISQTQAVVQRRRRWVVLGAQNTHTHARIHHRHEWYDILCRFRHLNPGRNTEPSRRIKTTTAGTMYRKMFQKQRHRPRRRKHITNARQTAKIHMSKSVRVCDWQFIVYQNSSTPTTTTTAPTMTFLWSYCSLFRHRFSRAHRFSILFNEDIRRSKCVCVCAVIIVMICSTVRSE